MRRNFASLVLSSALLSSCEVAAASPEASVSSAMSASRPPPRPFERRADPDLDTEPEHDVELTKPATKAAGRLLELADTIDRTRTDTVYSHTTKVRRKQGVFHFDCSGMINWMLERVGPKALAATQRERPVASTYVRVIEKAPTDRARKGWQRVAHIERVRPGDIFAWRRPAHWPPGGNTGHVGIVLAKPEPVDSIPGAYTVRILDSTRWAHQYDSRDEDETGFGTGTILIMTDGAGQGIGYGWHGTNSRGWHETPVVFGRIHG